MSASKGVSSAQISLAWLLAQGEDIAIIPGTKRVHYLEQNWGSREVKFSTKELATLTQLSDKHTVVGNRY